MIHKNAMIVHVNTERPETSKLFLLILTLFAVIFGGFIFLESQNTERIYESILGDTEPTAVESVELPGYEKQLVIPNWSLFTPGNLWSLVSRTEKLPENFRAEAIITTSVPHAHDAASVSNSIETPLKQLMAGAEQDGINLMLSSAYRSIQEQQTLYEEFVETRGKELADLYVAAPGTSEHHTGLSVDFADASSKCEADSNDCSLGSESAAWLAEHAHEYGFILRYPEGKKPITGIAFEPWHYRYVGIPLANAVYQSDLTLDEILEQIYPKYATE